MNVESFPHGDPRTARGVVAIGSAVYDVRERVLHVGGERHRLEPRVAGVLALLVQRQGAPVTRDEFLDTVWDGDGSDEALTQTISRLRRLLDDAEAILTIPRVGYRLAETPRAGVKPPSVPAWAKARALLGRVSASHALSFVAGFAIAGGLFVAVFGVPSEKSIEQEIVITGPGSDRELVRYTPGQP